MGYGVNTQEKRCSGPRSKSTHSSHNTQKSFDPPLTPPSMGYPGTGGGGVGGSKSKNQKIHWGIIFCPKMMILQGVRRLIPYLGVCYANETKRGGVYNACACA